MTKPQPFIKWVGGKRQLLHAIRENMPRTFNRYFEPFVGGGAVFFDLTKRGSYIADVNKELIDTYRVVADAQKVRELIARLDEHTSKNAQHGRTHYETVRNLDRSPTFAEISDVERAARFIYLNKTCFNGVHRVNSRGHNNVPYGDNPKARICDARGLLACHDLLRDTEIAHAPFEAVLDKAKDGDLVYFDPPYVPLSKTSSFTKYSQDDFSIDMQRKLCCVIDALTARGVFVMVSNSYCDETKRLYSNYNQIPVSATRMLNSKGNRRGAIQEMLVTSFAPPEPPLLFSAAA